MTKEQQKILLSLARTAIDEGLGIGGEIPKMPDDPLFSERRGVFVTIEEGKSLRGCIGNIEPVYKLWNGVINNARAAAFSDPRFWPMTKEEWPGMHIEISVLTVPLELEYDSPRDLIEKLSAKKPGVIIKKGFYEATFLPQVWEDLKDPEVFLSHLCVKSGLEASAWKTENLEISTYEAEVFSE